MRYKANHRLFALKALSKAQYSRPEEVQRVLNESDALQKVKHPFIMRMFGAWQVGDASSARDRGILRASVPLSPLRAACR